MLFIVSVKTREPLTLLYTQVTHTYNIHLQDALSVRVQLPGVQQGSLSWQTAELVEPQSHSSSPSTTPLPHSCWLRPTHHTHSHVQYDQSFSRRLCDLYSMGAEVSKQESLGKLSNKCTHGNVLCQCPLIHINSMLKMKAPTC